MFSQPRILRAVVAGLVVSLATLVYREFRSDAGSGFSPRAVEGEAVVRVERPLNVPVVASPGSADVARKRILMAGPRPDPVVPAAVAQLLPSVTVAVTNWKEFKPQKITIAPYPDMAIEFEVTSIREEHGRTVWTGRNAAIDGAFLVTAATENEWHATLVIPPAGTFDAQIAGSLVTMLTRDDGNNLCGVQPAVAGLVAAPLGESPAEIPALVAAATDSATAVDVLFFYDSDVLASAQGNASTIETQLISYVAASNVALTNSQVTNFQWRYVGAYQVPAYTATTDMADDLNVITGVTPGTRSGTYVASPNPVSIFAMEKAQLHGADQVVLYVGSQPRRNYAGIAWIPTSANLAYHSAVVAWPNSPGNSSSFLTVAHEMAHNFGCYHDRATESAADNDGLFHYGFRYTRAGRDTGTIMSYASQAVPYYSNPSVTFEGVALGVAEDQPKAANNARVLRESAVGMIASRAAVDSPEITAQPQSATVPSGQAFTMSVTATGNSLTYQWKLAGVDIAGASGASYAKSSATTADAGSYTVVISNIAGQVTSSAAILTVSSAASGGSGGSVTPVTTTAGSSTPASTSGGGGGGAIDAWFASVCGMFVMARCILKNRRR